jgi:NADH-quinone oxidoreductase subunit K
MNELNEIALLYNYLLVGGLLFTIGLLGFLVRRNMIVVFLCAEMMLQGISLSLIAWGRYHGDWGGQMLVLFIIAIAACEAAIAMALILILTRHSGRLDLAFWQDLREEGQPAHVDREIPEERLEPKAWPKLTPAGIEPEVDDEDHLYRSRI